MDVAVSENQGHLRYTQTWEANEEVQLTDSVHFPLPISLLIISSFRFWD